MNFTTLPQQLKPVLLFSGAANAVTCDTVSLKNVLKFWWLIFHAGANDTDLVLTPTSPFAVAGRKKNSPSPSAAHPLTPGTPLLKPS